MMCRYSRLLLFKGVKWLKNPINGGDIYMCEVMRKMGYGESKFHKMTIHKLMIHKHENICNGVYWNDSVPGWKLSG